ncbi:16S rRNA (adenine(1518)-N(6)/adenine(1519)-N(6))-dimethyltransferase RsmA [Marinilongibacter aquaticus]|uniref:16S rRNA (adenine(1518)-N(6)/adenine(1519)-N(6))- dimethyltransferase RsmA n=1 Tax=Marinilongibacter aquaticus TaxID=2975157 RepID=UPI0021BCFD13|nr:16S rRNA (adenine(1518)-N(6)/adenine(1519)-N(6))-dimethyltransferase RsmA [Marinilongibacter aquaticus]UBM58458.1 16S rRNA (adenine(1518)-N(6)/adenine(1519)-N(6))-dimethyltransferase RsmA [Marinilongibacter aquaticus]
MNKVRAKKHLGQHFLKEESIAKRIVDLLQPTSKYRKALEIGPGMGVLTQFLLQRTELDTHVVELDNESVDYLQTHYPVLLGKIYGEDFLRMPLKDRLGLGTDETIGLIGNFPYNISSQIFFKVLEERDTVVEVVCMLQKEVARRIASPPGNKEYGILSVLLQAYYDIDYHFTIPPGAFNPPPKVDSGIIRLTRNENKRLECDEKRFFSVVKVGFNQRRKKLSNALKPLGCNFSHPLLDKRAEQLSYKDFVELTNQFSASTL